MTGEKAEKEELALNSGRFTCERMHAKISKTTCLSRQFALVQGSKRFLFPECGSCSQGKIIAKEQQNMIGDKKEGATMQEQKKPGEETGEEKVKKCEECKERPPISKHSRLCAVCLQKKAMKARAEKAEKAKKDKKPLAAEKAKPAINPQPLPKALPKTDLTMVQVDFGGYAQIFDGVKKLAEEEIRPVELQIIYLLKSYLGRQKEPLKVA